MLKKNLNSAVKEHYQKIFTKEMIWKKIFCFSIVLLIVLTSSFLIREEILSNNIKESILIKNFLEIQVEFNKGISFSWFNENPEFAFWLQLITIFLIFAIFVNNPLNIFDYSICFMLMGGLVNTIDRKLVDNFQGIFYTNSVVDYLKFSFLPQGPIFNFPDVSISIGWISLIIIGIFLMVKLLSKNKLKKQNNEK